MCRAGPAGTRVSATSSSLPPSPAPQYRLHLGAQQSSLQHTMISTTFFLLLALGLAHGATIRTTDSYENIPIDPINSLPADSLHNVPSDSYQNIQDSGNADIRENLIEDEDAGDIEGLLPPKPDAKDYFPTAETFFRKGTYILDNENHTLRLEGEPEKVPELSDQEQAAMRAIQMAFAKLIEEAGQATATAADGEDPLKHLIFVSDDGSSLEMTATDEKAADVNVRESDVVSSDEVTAVPNGEPETVTNVESSSVEEDGRSDDDAAAEAGLMGFLHSLWDAVQQSVGYATRLITGSESESDNITSVPDSSSTTSAPASPSAPSSASSAGTIAALEETAPYHSLPAQEFESRRDVDSLLYGRGIA